MSTTITTGTTNTADNTNMEDLWGKLNHLTIEQHNNLKSFLSKAPSIELEDAKFSIETKEQVSLRFLRARKFDIILSLQLLHDCYITLKDKKAELYANMDPNEILGCEVNVLRKFYPHSQSGHDKLNRPLLYDNSGNMNMNGITHLTTPEGLIGYHFWTMEKALDDLFNSIAAEGCSRGIPPVAPTGLGVIDPTNTTGSTLHNCSTCAIIDLQGISLSDVTSSAVINVSVVYSVI